MIARGGAGVVTIVVIREIGVVIHVIDIVILEISVVVLEKLVEADQKHTDETEVLQVKDEKVPAHRIDLALIETNQEIGNILAAKVLIVTGVTLKEERETEEVKAVRKATVVVKVVRQIVQQDHHKKKESIPMI